MKIQQAVVVSLQRGKQRQKFQFGDGKRQCGGIKRPLGNDNDVMPKRKVLLIAAKKVPHHALDAVADNSAPGLSRNGQAKTPWATVVAVADEHDKLFRVMATPRVITKQKIRPPTQPVRGQKP